MTTLDSNHLLDARAVANALNVTVETLREWRQSGDGPDYYLLPDNRPAYQPDDLYRWVQSPDDGPRR